MTFALPFKAASSWLAAVILAGAVTGPAVVRAGEDGPATISESRPFGGSLASITLRGVDAKAAPGALDAAFSVFDGVDRVMNEWLPGSPLAQLNAAAGSGRWTALPPDLCEVLRIALDGARRTGGRFDATWAALRDVWRFDGDARVPEPGVVAARCALVGSRRVELEADGEACRARLPVAGMAVGLGGIAKGWAVDRAADALRAAGLRDFVIKAGGDLYVGGRDGQRPWRVAIRDPRGPPDSAIAWVEAEDRAVSTSGDYEHFFFARGRRWHHLIDPRDCQPARASRSVTVVARSAVEAEVLSKAVFIAGGRAGLALAAREGAAAVIVTSRGERLASPALARALTWRARGRPGAARR